MPSISEAPGRPWAKSLHRAVDRVDATWRPTINRLPAAERAWIATLDAVVGLQADRAYFRRAILPAVARQRFARILFVGVRGYTSAYAPMFRQTGAEYWTTDIDPGAATYGEPGHHVVADVVDLAAHWPAGTFDLVLMNGVLGWGCDGDHAMNAAVTAARAVMQAGGALLVGWNSHQIADPDGLDQVRALFTPQALPGLARRQTFADSDHVYSWYRAV